MQTRTQALLDLVENDRRAQCAAILGEAEAQAAALRAQAERDARARVRQAIGELRARASATRAAAEADLQTRRRLHAQRQVEALLALAWTRLPERLRARWADPATRARWIEQALTDARGRLPSTGWTLHYGAHWPDDERQALARRLQAESGTAAQFVHDPRIAAGLRVGAGGNVVDATLAGLLADRDEIGGRLIGWLEATP